jgi:hypothetical protein
MRLPSCALLLALAALPASAAELVPAIDTAGLPSRSVPEPVPPRPVPEWTRTHFRVGHLPGSPRWPPSSSRPATTS